MRISGGFLKGRKPASRRVLSGKNGASRIRPTSSKVREAVFDILQNDIPNAVFLDLYAGTGTVGFEALSRGADIVYFVENDPLLSRKITRFVKEAALEENARIYRDTAEVFLRRAAASGMCFDIIFADPPYASGEIAEILPLIDESPLLCGGGSLMVEHASRTQIDFTGRSLNCIRQYKYGDTMLSLFRKLP